MKLIVKYLTAFFNLLYPKICLSCASSLLGNEDFICTKCRLQLPETDFHLCNDNPVEKLLWGRLAIEHATSFIYFEKDGTIQKLLHQLKYQNKKELGVYLGKLFGKKIIHSKFKAVDLIVPVPLHPSRKLKRGYNQSEMIARGLAQELNKPVECKNLKRTKFTKTQTAKGRYERWQNVENAFSCGSPKLFENKHILLIDDVVTTGATLEAVGKSLEKIEGVKISIATISMVN